MQKPVASKQQNDYLRRKITLSIKFKLIRNPIWSVVADFKLKVDRKWGENSKAQ